MKLLMKVAKAQGMSDDSQVLVSYSQSAIINSVKSQISLTINNNIIV